MTPAAGDRLARSVRTLLTAAELGYYEFEPCERRALASLLVDAGLMELATRTLTAHTDPELYAVRRLPR